MRSVAPTAWLLLVLGFMLQPGAHPHVVESAATPAAPGALPEPSSGVEPARVVEVHLVAGRSHLELLPGRTTGMLTYNGQSPGPLLEFHEGDRVVVRLRNELDEPTTIHWHGLHLPFTADGSPFHPVQPGEEYTYEFTVRPGTAGTYWYHPHPHHRTGHQVGRGLYGPIIVRAQDDPLRHLPEQLIVLSDNRLREDGSLDFPDPDSPAGRVDFENGREGDVVFVNGVVMPTIPITAGDVQRWRVINASGARVYRLALEGHTFLHIGTDGGLFEHPVEVDEITLANGERAELLVRATAAPGTSAVLRALPYDRYIPQTRPSDWNRPRDLLGVEYAPVTARPASERGSAPAAPIPATLRRVPPIDTADVTVRRTITMTQGFLNGRAMDMQRIDESARLGATEIWEIENLVGMDHPFHMHGFQFQVLDRNGVPEPVRRWKDTVNVPRHSTVRIVVRFDNYPGRWMFHCHILSHEDAGMMGVLEVR